MTFILENQPDLANANHLQNCFKHFAACRFRPEGKKNISSEKSNHNHYVGLFILYIHHPELQT